MWSSQPLPAKELELKKLLLFSGSVMSDSLGPHRLQHARIPRPSLSPPACSNSSSLSWLRLSNHLILCCPLLFLPSIFPFIRIYFNESVPRIRWPKKKFYCRVGGGGGRVRRWEVGWSRGMERVGEGRFIICNVLEGTVEGALSLGIGLKIGSKALAYKALRLQSP